MSVLGWKRPGVKLGRRAGQALTYVLATSLALGPTLATAMPAPPAADTTALAPPLSGAGYTNPDAINIPDNANADPYPSTITVPAFAGLIGQVRVTLHGLTHTHPNDLDILLVGPTGASTVLMSDSGGAPDVVDLTVTFDDFAPAVPASLVAGTFRPTNSGAGDPFPLPAPPGPHGATLGVFGGTSPIGSWHLLVVDDAGVDLGDIARGWSITFLRPEVGDVTGDTRSDLITYQGASVSTFSSTGKTFSGAVGATGGAITLNAFGAATPYPSTVNIAGFAGTVGKVTVNFNDIDHTFPDDVDILLVGPGGQSAILMSDAGGGGDLVNTDLTFDQTVPAVYSLPDETLINSGTYRPTNHGAGDTFPAPAPAGPYTADLSVFNGIDPNGTWSLYATDDLGGISGSMGSWSITVQVAPFAAVPETSDTFDVYVADVTGDGRTDAIFRVKGPGTIGLTPGDLWVERSTGTAFGSPELWSNGWGTSYELYFADATGDGKADLIARVLSTGEVLVFASTGTTFSSAGTTLWSYGWSSGYDLYFGDVNGDLRADLIGRYYGPAAGLTGDVYVALSNGSSSFAFNGRWTYGFSAGYTMYVADVSGDTAMDLVGRLVATGDVFVLRSTGTSFVFDVATPWATGLGSNYDLMFKQVNQSSRAALVSRHRTAGVIEVRLKQGNAYGPPTTWLTGIYKNFAFPEDKPQSIH
jgi:subtilisin-like proprotein convertase family protein